MILITIIAFIFILAFSITIHEFGHFLIAKWGSIPVEKFSLGFGPPIFKKQIGETDFRIAYFPLGGYVKLADEDEGEIIPSFKKITDPPVPTAPENPVLPKKPGFYNVPIYRRIAVLISGPIFNILSALIILIFIFSVFGLLVTPYRSLSVEPGSYTERAGFLSGDSLISINGSSLNSWEDVIDALEQKSDPNPRTISFIRENRTVSMTITWPSDSLDLKPFIPPAIGQVRIGGPAYRAGLRKGDLITSINGQEMKTWEQMWKYIRSSPRKTLVFEYVRNGDEQSATLSPAATYDPIQKDTVGQIGILMALKRYYPGFFKSVSMAMDRGVNLVWLTLKTLYELIIGKISRRALGGPIAIARLSGESASWGLENLFTLLAVISINLGLVNLFPLPAFDGGQTLIALFEGIRRKRLSRRTRLVLQNIGYAIILLLIIFVTYNDLTR